MLPSPNSFAPSSRGCQYCSVAIASQLGPNKLQGSLPSNPATRRHQCRSRKLDNAAFTSEQGVMSSRTQDTLATSPRSCSRAMINSCMNRTQPPVSRPIPHRTEGHRAGLSYTMRKPRTPSCWTQPSPGLEAASQPASQTWTIRVKLSFSETLAPGLASDGLVASLLVKIWRRCSYRMVGADAVPTYCRGAQFSKLHTGCMLLILPHGGSPCATIMSVTVLI